MITQENIHFNLSRLGELAYLPPNEAGLAIQQILRAAGGDEALATGNGLVDCIVRICVNDAERLDAYFATKSTAASLGGIAKKESGIAKKESGIAKKESGIAKKKSGIAKKKSGSATLGCGTELAMPKSPRACALTDTDTDTDTDKEQTPTPTPTPNGGPDSGSVGNSSHLSGRTGSDRYVDAKAALQASVRDAMCDHYEAFLSLLNDPKADVCAAVEMEFGRGAWRKFAREKGVEAVRITADTLVHEMRAGEVPDNPAAVLTTRLQSLPDAKTKWY